jgi:D-alanyl-D-alanine carboxypeptidase (penicillin-binding protein 5/6)
MLTHAPRPVNNPPLLPVLRILTVWLGLFCWTGLAVAQSKSGFLFRDYGAKPKLTPPDEIKAVGALLVDGQTGEVLYARNPDEHLLPASTTKLMTALIVYEKVGLRGNVTIQEDDTKVEPSSVPLIPGETVSVDKLFHALLIESANDTARALGRYVAGSTNAFVAMMNQRALAMGCFNTHFANPNGLPAPAGTHYTSCADLMRIFRAVIAHPDLRKICSTKEYTIETASGVHTFHNHNRLLGYYPGMGPAKTGWTIASRHTYAAAVTQNGREILLTLLDSPNKWADAQILFNWGFAQPQSQPAETSTSPAVEPAPSGLASSSPTPAAPAKKTAKHPKSTSPSTP